MAQKMAAPTKIKITFIIYNNIEKKQRVTRIAERFRFLPLRHWTIGVGGGRWGTGPPIQIYSGKFEMIRELKLGEDLFSFLETTLILLDKRGKF